MKNLPPKYKLAIIDLAGLRKLEQTWFKTLCEGSMSDKPVIIGIDEVGVGCVYGPVCVAAVANLTGWRLNGVKDSKKIKVETVRRGFASEIQHNTLWVTAMIHAPDIQRLGMKEALRIAILAVRDNLIQRLKEKGITPIHVILDGENYELSNGEGYTCESIAQADATQFEVSAASILAKVTRDNWVHEQVKANPQLSHYGLDDNKGYASDVHGAALLRFGMTPDHREKYCKTYFKSLKAKSEMAK